MGYAENPKKHWNLSASAITNSAFMPTDADAADIHVPVWMGQLRLREALMEIQFLNVQHLHKNNVLTQIHG